MARVNVRYEPNKAAWAEILLDPQIGAACFKTAVQAKRYAVSISPEGDRQRTRKVRRGRRATTGNYRYKDSFKVEQSIVKLRRGQPRVAATLSNDAPHAVPVEYGNRHIRPHRVFGRTYLWLVATS